MAHDSRGRAALTVMYIEVKDQHLQRSHMPRRQQPMQSPCMWDLPWLSRQCSGFSPTRYQAPHLFEAMKLLRVARCHSNSAKQAEAHGPLGHCMVARRPADAEARRRGMPCRAARHDCIHQGHGRARSLHQSQSHEMVTRNRKLTLVRPSEVSPAARCVMCVPPCRCQGDGAWGNTSVP